MWHFHMGTVNLIFKTTYVLFHLSHQEAQHVLCGSTLRTVKEDLMLHVHSNCSPRFSCELLAFLDIYLLNFSVYITFSCNLFLICGGRMRQGINQSLSG